MKMKRIYALFLSFILVFYSCVYDPMEVYAGGNPFNLVNDLLDLKKNLQDAIGYEDIYDNDPLWNKLRSSVNSALDKIGFPHYAGTLINPLSDPVLELKKMYAEKNNKDQDSVSNKEAASYMLNMLNDCDIHDNNINFSGDMNIFLKNYAQDYIDSSGITYFQSFDIGLIPNQFSSGVFYKKLCNFCSEYQYNFYVCKFQFDNTAGICLIPKGDYGFLRSGSQNDYAGVLSSYSYKTWTNYPDDNDYIFYLYDSEINEFVEYSQGLYKNYLSAWGQLRFSNMNFIGDNTYPFRHQPAYVCFNKIEYLPVYGK